MADSSSSVGNQTLDRTPPPVDGGNGQNRIQPVSDVHIDVEVEDRLFRTIKRRLFPQEIEGILWQAQTGDLFWQEQLWSVMVDKWYRLSTNLKKLRMEVQAFEYEFQPWSNKNEKPSTRALDKANFCEQAFFGMTGNVAWQEHDFIETIGDLVDGLVSGFMVCEVYWESRTGLGIVPQSTRWIPARYYRYPYVMNAVDRLMLNPSGMLGSTQLLDFPPGQFLVSIEQSHTNFPVFTAPFRPLCAWWVASQFGLEWLMQYAQIFGFPQRVGYYEPGDDKVYAELVKMMKKASAATWGVFPKGTQVEITQHAQGSGPMPHERLVDLADRSCDIMLLGQTLTSDVERSGSRALGAVHKSVFDHIVEASAKSVCKKITKQIIPKLIELNFGDTDELPTLQPVIHTPIDSVQLATAYNIFFNTMRIPVSLKQLYERIQFQQPEEGDEVYEPPAPVAKGGFGGDAGGFGGPPPLAPPPGAGGMPTEEGIGTREPPISGEVAMIKATGFNPDEPRDKTGKWTAGGGGGEHKHVSPTKFTGMLEGAKESKIRNGTVLWHGTNEKSDSFSGNEVYLTDQHDQAEAYARGAHHIESSVSQPVLYKTKVKGGKSLNVNGPLEKAMGEGDDFDDILNHAAKFARENGYRYLEYDHPSVGKDEYHHVVVSLYPNEDVKKVGWHNVKISGEAAGDDPDDEIDPDDVVDARREAAVIPQELDRGPAEEAAARETEAYFKHNAHSIKGLRWKSILDDKTTIECRELANKRWTYPGFQPRGHDTPFPGFPPIKWNCRSNVVPILKTWPQILAWLKGGFGK